MHILLVNMLSHAQLTLGIDSDFNDRLSLNKEIDYIDLLYYFFIFAVF